MATIKSWIIQGAQAKPQKKQINPVSVAITKDMSLEAREPR